MWTIRGRRIRMGRRRRRRRRKLRLPKWFIYTEVLNQSCVSTFPVLPHDNN
jgi:hypothetical protein